MSKQGAPLNAALDAILTAFAPRPYSPPPPLIVNEREAAALEGIGAERDRDFVVSSPLADEPNLPAMNARLNRRRQ